MENLQQILEYYALKYPHKIAIRFLARGEKETETITYLQLQQQAQIVSINLLSQYKKSEKALLVFDASIDFIIAFWGCVYAGIVAVPIPIPNGNKGINNVSHIVEDANISFIISHDCVQNRLYKKFQENSKLKKLNWLNIKKKNFKTIDIFKIQLYSPNDLLLLQYTSGSTNQPKGVKVSHRNMIANQEGLKKAFYSNENSVFVSWLPHYHDMGLMGKIIQATFCGATLVLMPSIAFIQKPFRWLQAISTYKGTNSAAPNFAYEDCFRNITYEQLNQLDLSSWKVAWNAAEPVHAITLVKFSNKFSQCGFKWQALIGAYGMAEATLGISVANVNSKLKLLAIDEAKFKKEDIKVIEKLFVNSSLEQINKHKKIVVDCGTCIPKHQIKIVNPQNNIECDKYKVGEIWFSGESVAQGYLNKESLTQETFYATIKNSHKTFLRTGDLGFLDEDNNVFIVGRNKDMLIIRGENYAPQDIEFSIFNSHETFVNSACAVFSVIFEEEERVVIVQEIKRTQRKKVDFSKLLIHIKEILSQEYQLQLFALVFINQATLPKTTSGKVKRRLCKHLFTNNELNPLYSWIQTLDEKIEIQNEIFVNQLSYEKLIQWLEQWIKKYMQKLDYFETSNNFSSYGMDSKSIALMIYDLENFIGYELEPTLCWNYPNPDTLINYIINQIKNNELVPLKGK
ncbi:AMP-binding protein [Malaciobacter mytili]|uniref:AMP-binding protein n=1 Tax=Malaciobacter mytili TaxID=603050 RepID=UPI003BB0FA0C